WEVILYDSLIRYADRNCGHEYDADKAVVYLFSALFRELTLVILLSDFRPAMI
ncbi:MAG: hypothetical protein UT02_C0033G0009, partial [Parcubacteria group bacterium GW2011_GWC2_38_7]